MLQQNDEATRDKSNVSFLSSLQSLHLVQVYNCVILCFLQRSFPIKGTFDFPVCILAR